MRKLIIAIIIVAVVGLTFIILAAPDRESAPEFPLVEDEDYMTGLATNSVIGHDERYEIGGLFDGKTPDTLRISFAAENTSCGVKLKYKSESLYRGKTLKNKLVGAKGTVKWKSSNSKIATVSSKGVITAKTLGKCTISATYKGKTYKCKIKVIRRLPDGCGPSDFSALS